MPRVYRRKLGAKRFKDYTEETLEKCLSEVLNGKISANKAAKKYNIPKGTLINKMHGRHIKKHGGQTVFMAAEETDFVEGLVTCANWGFPLNTLDLRLSAKSYLDRIGREARFRNNLPGGFCISISTWLSIFIICVFSGPDWAKSFLSRHRHILAERLANNIKRSRAAVDVDVLSSFFDELSRTLEGVKPEAIFNYDESNLSDDPGKKKLIFNRGVKYPDNVINFSKSAVTLMLCVSASGDMLPPYVVYKAANLWDSWREGGPRGAPCCAKKCCAKGTRYNRSNHGWFDAICFSDWFKSSFLPHAKLIEGKKVLLGDNLSSHFTKDVLKLCKENNIDFVCLPPNATHLCQPLDVSFFGPMKGYWKNILHDWKKSNPTTSSVEKSVFPRLLKKLFDELAPVASKNARSGFKACGIFPLCKEKLLDKIPKTTDTPKESGVGAIIVDYLKDQRNPNKRDSTIKRKKLNVVPGRSVAFEDSPEKIDDDDNNSLPSTSGILNVKRKICEESDESVSDDEIDKPNQFIFEDNIQEEPDNGDQQIQKDSWVVVEYQTKKTKKHFIGQIASIDSAEASVKFVKRSKNDRFLWPNVDDIDVISLSDIKKKICSNPIVCRRGQLLFDIDMTSFNFQ